MPIIPPTLQPPKKPLTVRETKIVKQYGTLQAYKSQQQSQQQSQQIQTQVNKIISKIKRGEITSFSQIPKEYLQYLNLPQNYFQSTQQQQQKLETNAYNLARQWVDKKSRGKSVVRVNYGESSDDEMYRKANTYYKEFLKDKKIKRAISEGNRMVLKAEARGFKSVKEYQQVYEGFKRQGIREKQLAPIPQIIKSEVKRFQQAGYTKQESQILAQWSTEHQMTPTLQETKRIIESELKYSIAPEFRTTTPSQELMGRFGIEPRESFLIPLKPYLEKREIGSEQGIPIVQIYRVDPTKGTERKATSKEIEQYSQRERDIEYRETTLHPESSIGYYGQRTKEIFFGETMGIGGEEEQPYYFGDKEYTTEYPQPKTMGLLPYEARGTMLDFTIPGEKVIVMKDIKPEKTGIWGGIRTTIVPATSLDQPVYLPTKEAMKEYSDLLEATKYGAAGFLGGLMTEVTPNVVLHGKELDQFLKNQMAKYKKDLGRLNLLKAKKKLSKKEKEEDDRIVKRLNIGMKGSGWDIIKESAEKYEREEKKVKVLGLGISPTMARGTLMGLTRAYQMEEEILKYQVAFTGAGALLGTTKMGASILGGIGKIAKPSRFLIAPTGLTLGGISATQEYKRSEDIAYTIGAGLGTATGFFGAVYSKPIIEKGTKSFKKFIELEKELLIDKRAMTAGGRTKQKMAKQKQIQKKKKQKKVTRAEVKEILQYKKEGKFEYYGEQGIARQTFQEKYKKAKTLLDLLKQNTKGDRELFKKGFKELESLLKETYGDTFLKEFFIQEGVIPEFSTTERKSLITGQIIRETPKLEVTAPKRDSIYGGLGLYELTEEVSAIGIKPVERQLEKQGMALISPQISKLKTEQKSALALGLTSIQITKPAEKQIEQQATSLISPQISISKQEQKSKSELIFGGGLGYHIPEKRLKQKQKIEITPPHIKIPFFFPGEKYTKGTQIGYQTSVKDKGKWKKVSTKPHTKQSAKSLGARIVDNTTSAQFKIEPMVRTRVVKGKKVKTPQVFRGSELETTDSYFGKVVNKFRDFVIRKGKKVPTKNRWIEKKTKRIDTRGEAQGMTVAQWQSRQRKRIMGLPIRRTKGRKKSRSRFFRL